MNLIDIKPILFNIKYQIFRRQTMSFYRMLLKNEKLSLDELAHINWVKRKALLTHAYENSSFYHKKYSEAGLDPQDIRIDDDWNRIPILTRDNIKQHIDSILTVQKKSINLMKFTTGGTTGVPVTTYSDRRVPYEALGWRMMRWWGINPEDDGAFAWRMRHKPGISTLINKLAWWPTRKLRFDATFMTPTEISVFLRAFNKLKPPLIQGYTGAIAHLAQYILDNHLSVHNPKAVWVTSSPLNSIQRGYITRAFRAPVYDQYGSCEVRHISAQCQEKKALHMHYDSVHLEFVDDNAIPKPIGQKGRILITDLENIVFPLIRYENGDEGRALEGRCPCGISLPLMDAVAGRVSDNLRLPGGGTLNGEYLTTLFDSYPDSVKQFQVRQGRDYSIVVCYIPNPECSNMAAVLLNVKRTLEVKTGYSVPVTMRPSEEIQHDRGKLRFVISEVE